MQPLASQIAIDVLKKGGTAVDAAIAANAALGLMEPVSCGVGGDLFAIVWDPKTKHLYGYNGSGRSPKGRTLADMKRFGVATIVAGPSPGEAAIVDFLTKIEGQPPVDDGGVKVWWLLPPHAGVSMPLFQPT